MSRLDSVAIGPSVETMPTVPTATEAGPVLRAYVPVAIEYLSDQEDETWDFIELACFLGLETSTADLWAVGRPSFLISQCRLNADSANVVHMTVRPQDIVDEEDASKGKGMGRDRGDGESNAGCRCVVQ
ncbi:hypothetical protein M7I_0478 [Glarea lozoyensis 74030]|uniref:Uncharacterized protein n=1 Tax=Glarea lozoyensis (strain ATCC 74030 / MF5533) TaxID=1104152 RepID=H0EDM3_GLAL7|nr:hypothetical protein M7I_0478 [Glarea lozoyensis 74030]